MNDLGLDTPDGGHLWIGGLITDEVGCFQTRSGGTDYGRGHSTIKPSREQLQQIREHLSGLLSGLNEYDQMHIERLERDLKALRAAANDIGAMASASLTNHCVVTGEQTHELTPDFENFINEVMERVGKALNP